MAIVGIDWGSTNCRAYLIEAGAVIDSWSGARGVKSITDGRYSEVFEQILAPWRGQFNTVYLSGMITSRTGWCETPYAKCPINLKDLHGQARTLIQGGVRLYFMPGLCQFGEHPDVMRGEELQLLGLPPESDRRTVVMPGTHSKWAIVHDQQVERFRTIPTGEFYDLVLNHSLAGQLAAGDSFDAITFDDAVQRGFQNAVPVSDLFLARSRVILGRLEPDAVASFVSGLLIGNEIREGSIAFPHWRDQLTLIGEPVLCRLYARAFNELGASARTLSADFVSKGFVRIANSQSAQQKIG